jgi:carbamoyl-phosphate synthase large subunit
VDTILGPEMKSTGEVMGVGKTFGEAFVKSQLGAGTRLPKPFDASGSNLPARSFLTVKNSDKPRAVDVARQLSELGFVLVATQGHGGGHCRCRRTREAWSTRSLKGAPTS